MLSRHPASTASRSCSRDFIRTFAHNPQVGSRQLRRGAASFITPKHGNNVSRQTLTTTSTSSVPRKCNSQNQNQGWQSRKRLASTAASSELTSTTHAADRKDAIYDTIDNINQNDVDLEEMLDEMDLLEDHHGALNLDGTELEHAFTQTIGHRDEEALESRVRLAKQQFGEFLPKDYLNHTETQLYTRLYGEPIFREMDLEVEDADEEKDADQLLREDGQGGWEEVEYDNIQPEDEAPVVYDMELGPQEGETIAMQRTREVAEQLGGQIMLDQYDDEAFSDSTPRLHPLTTEAKFSTDPSTVFIPKDTVTGPISAILSQFPNRHIAEVSHRVFGGRGLPNSTSTAPSRAQLPQLPIPLEASQRYMSEMEANAYLAVLYPGMYASALSVLVEIRKRLGSDWIRDLISQEGGPNVLDASAGGAGILAWRDVLRAEWELMVPDHPEGAPIPLGRSTVVTGSDALKLRASAMLDNTTFLPRLPDYVHIREKPTLEDKRNPKRKQYDIIIAPHSLLGINEEYLRKEHVENLWNLLNPNGGVLILLEKGRQKGFEAIAGARDMLLKRHISSPGSTHYENFTNSPNDDQYVEKEPGMIVAPCTNHEKCPMYNGPGQSKGRKDYCHFQQRFIRPTFLQRIMGAKDRNHEDAQFSYVAVQRGVDLRQRNGIIQGSQATDAAFAGYEHLQDDAAEGAETSDGTEAAQDAVNEMTEAKDDHDFHTLSLPRSVYPPMKRRGHVIFDFCTPAGNIERWTVPRSFSRQAFKDARKAQWGDLWALGAKTRIPRNLTVGDKHGDGKKERLARRAALQAGMDEEGDMDAQQVEEQLPADHPDMIIPKRKKGQKIPSWKKHQGTKKLRQASRKHSAKFGGDEA